MSAVKRRLETCEGKADAAQSLARYRSALRAYLTGFTLLTIGLQTFFLLRIAGVAQPLGLDPEATGRLFFVLSGLLFSFIGNVSPKMPHIPSRWIDAARQQKGHRFTGWVFMLGGVAFCVVALAAPSEHLVRITSSLTATMIVLPLLHLVVLTIESRRAAGSGGRRA